MADEAAAETATDKKKGARKGSAGQKRPAPPLVPGIVKVHGSALGIAPTAPYLACQPFATPQSSIDDTTIVSLYYCRCRACLLHISCCQKKCKLQVLDSLHM